MPLCTNNFRNSPGLAFYRIPKARRIKRECVREYVPSASHFYVFFLSIPPSVLLFWAVLTPLKHFISISALFVSIRVPPNNPQNARAPSLGPRLSLFSEVSYFGFPRLAPRPVCAIQVTREDLEPSANFPKLDRWRHIRNRRGRLATRLRFCEIQSSQHWDLSESLGVAEIQVSRTFPWVFTWKSTVLVRKILMINMRIHGNITSPKSLETSFKSKPIFTISSLHFLLVITRKKNTFNNAVISFTTMKIHWLILLNRLSNSLSTFAWR